MSEITYFQELTRSENARAAEYFDAHQRAVFTSTSRLFAVLLPFQWLAGITAAYALSPLSWHGEQSSINPHVWFAILVGGIITSLPLFLVITSPDKAVTRHVVAAGQLLMSAVLIHVTGGRIETHFHIFGSLAFLAFYRDWRVLITATVVTAIDHFFRGWLYPYSIYGVLNADEWRSLEHAAWVIFTDVFLIASCRRNVKEMKEISIRSAVNASSEERYRAVVEQTSDGIVLMETDGLRVIDCNQAFSDLIRCKNIEEAKTISAFDFVTVDRDDLEKLSRIILDESSAITGERIYRRRDGSEVEVDIGVNCITYDGRSVFCLNVKDISERKAMDERLKLAYDDLEQRVTDRTAELVFANESMQTEVTERMKAEAESIEAKQFLCTVIDNLPNLIFVKDVRGNFVLANKAIADIFGTTPDALIGKTDADFSHNPEEARKFTEQDIKMLGDMQESFVPEELHTDIQGNVHWFQTCKKPVVLGENGDKYLIGVATDLTERKIMESQLRHAQKLESIGQLAAGIAHEINTPTQYVGDNTRFAHDAFSDISLVLGVYDDFLKAAEAGEIKPEMISQIKEKVEKADLEYLLEEVPNALQQSMDGVSRIAKIVQSMKDFAHPGTRDKQTVDLNRAIESTVTVARNEWKYVADLEMNFDKTLPLVPCYLGEFNQVVLNMVINAAHAIGDVVGDGSQGKGKIVISTTCVDNDWAEVRIGDSGSGIPQDIQGRIFDPFFTTKEVGKGTGQGLAISHTVIVDKHGGTLRFESETGHGTIFIIRLPLNRAESSEKEGN
ncbi:MAG: PAS domain S-box protein [Acidobacteriota bacterium]